MVTSALGPRSMDDDVEMSKRFGMAASQASLCITRMCGYADVLSM
jgi:hypothetical protein